MKVPVSGRMNVATGEMTFQYIECEELIFVKVMVDIALQATANSKTYTLPRSPISSTQS